MRDLNLLRTFLAVYRSGSFTSAAHLLGLSQPTVTTQIRALERQLGRQLFERLPRGVVPAPFADELAAQVVAPLDALAAVAGGDTDAPGSHDAPRPEPVHLAGPAELLCARALPALAPLVEDGVRLRVGTGLTDVLLEEMRAGGRHDLVLSTTRPRGRTLTAVPLMDEEFVLVAAPPWADRILTSARGAAARTGTPAGTRGTAGNTGTVSTVGTDDAAAGTADALLSALHAVPLVTYAEDLPIARRYWRHVFGKRLSCQAAVTVPDLRGVLSALTAGAGFSVLPRYLCLDELASGALVSLYDPEEPPINTAYLVQRPGSTANPHVVRVRDRLLEAARSW